MMVLHIDTQGAIEDLIDEAAAEAARRGLRVLRVVAFRGPDGVVRGTVLLGNPPE
jgi:hypothetical protein